MGLKDRVFELSSYFPPASQNDQYNDVASHRRSLKPASNVMRAFAESPVWSVLKRLTMGLALIALLSSILLVSDLTHRRTASAANAGAGARKFKAAIVYYAHSVSNEYCVNGLLDGLKANGLEEGKNWKLCGGCARGNDQHPCHSSDYDSSDVDLIMTISTPCLAGACSNVKHKKVVFTCVSDPIAAGRGEEPYGPFAIAVTGVGSFPPVSHMLDFMQKLCRDCAP